MNCKKCNFYCYDDEYICPNCEAKHTNLTPLTNLAKRFFDGSDNVARPVNIGTMTLYNDIAEVHTDFSQGALENTGLSTDIAINGDDGAFFSIAEIGRASCRERV